MAVFRYSATIKNREDYRESGTVVARTEDEAREKLKQYDFANARLRRLGGIGALFKAFTADIK